jgi:hypothetical protein
MDSQPHPVSGKTDAKGERQNVKDGQSEQDRKQKAEKLIVSLDDRL